MSAKVSGVEPGQRRLNGPQTTGREYRDLSVPEHSFTCDQDVAVPMRDGVELLADVFRPDRPGRYPVLVAASPYPRQIQDLGAPLGFIEAGASDFFVPRGYVHVIANLRGTGGAGGTFTFFDSQERRDLHDLVEWAAVQSWSDGNVGMIGISYFGMTQLAAAVERPPSLKAIFPLAATVDLFAAATHNGLMSSSFVTSFLYMIGMTSRRTNKLWRSDLVRGMRHLLREPAIHSRFAEANGEAAMTGLRLLLKLHHDPHPWDDLWRAIAVEHPVRDQWWDGRDLLPLLERVNIPVYLGCDWQNVPLHLPGTLATINALPNSPHVQVAMMGEHGLSWPWESLHIEALAWYDHWLKDHDTGILDGPHIRYVLPGADDGWHTSNAWPVPGAEFQEWALRADGTLAEDAGEAGEREFLALGAGLNRPSPSSTDPPDSLTWTSAPLTDALGVIGHIELRLDATASAADTAWIALLRSVEADGTTKDITAGFLRASLRRIDEQASTPGRPVIEGRTPQAVPINQSVNYRIPMVGNARRLAAGSRLQLVLTSDDQATHIPAMLGFRHASVGTSSLNRVASTSRLLLPTVATRNTEATR